MKREHRCKNPESKKVKPEVLKSDKICDRNVSFFKVSKESK
jgi:hypothetical protein